MQVSVVIPVYNSENILPKLVDQINKNLDLEFEIILVNDFSKDRSWEIIKKIAENKSNVKVRSRAFISDYFSSSIFLSMFFKSSFISRTSS